MTTTPAQAHVDSSSDDNDDDDDVIVVSDMHPIRIRHRIEDAARAGDHR
jgi:hypothetical protein